MEIIFKGIRFDKTQWKEGKTYPVVAFIKFENTTEKAGIIVVAPSPDHVPQLSEELGQNWPPEMLIQEAWGRIWACLCVHPPSNFWVQPGQNEWMEHLLQRGF